MTSSAPAVRCRVAGLLGALVVLVATISLPAAVGNEDAAARGAVVLQAAAESPLSLASRTARQLSAPSVAPTFQRAVATTVVVVSSALLLAIWPPRWMRSRRSRQAHLLLSAGPGPPSYS